ncbi:MAG: EAL domain-containing protein [Litorilituus sp.]|jgi:diguanylate cyclase (GGDEF)-like protein|nr:EAL domain-containing protein [Litorilituus sp.]
MGNSSSLKHTKGVDEKQSKVMPVDEKDITDHVALDKQLQLLQEQYKELQFRYKALFHLNQLSQECDELNHFYPQVHRTIASLMTAENFYIVTYEQTLSTLEFVYFVDEKDDWPKGALDSETFSGSFTNLVIESRQALLVTPAILKQLRDNNKIQQYGTLGTDWLGVPLLHNELVIGVMVVQSYSKKVRYTDQDLNLLTFAARHVVGAMLRLQDKERLTSAVSARTHELMAQIREREKAELLQASLYRISELTTDTQININDFYSKVHDIVGQLINATNFFIAKYDQETSSLNFCYVVDEIEGSNSASYKPRKLSNHFSELVIERRDTVLLTYQDMIDLYHQGKTIKPKASTYSWLGVPLIYSEHLLGIMVIQSYSPNTTYTQQDADLLKFVSTHVSSAINRRQVSDIKRQSHELLEQQVKLRTLALEEEIIQRKQAEKKLKHTATHDNLTGLPNRAIFIDLLNHAISRKKRKPELAFAILFLDLDRFKVVNDSLGHHAGDLLLKFIARELKAIVRSKDTVARLGGDEFVILIEDLESENEAYEIAQRITDFLQQPFTIENQLVFTGTSIGILFSDKRYNNANTMLRDADTAMYHAKDSGKGRYEVFDASMHRRVENALKLEADIREAIVWQEFIPYFQPIIKLGTEELKGVEALARWQSSKRGFVFPDDFIQLAEETHLILSIDLQILHKACQQLKSWQAQLSRHDLYVSCNLSCQQFFSPTLPDEIAKILFETGLKAEHLRVELTERALLENTSIVLENMNKIKRLGVKILLDDFGTGYSSLSYLHRFPIDVLKIDRAFINNVHEHEKHRAIIKTIIDLATNLNMETVGEGIENLADAQLLKQMGCLYGQGFYYSKPIPAIEMEQYLIDKAP